MENETGFIQLTSAKGDLIPVRYGLSAIRRLCKHFQCKLSELGDKVNEAINEDQIDLMLVLVKIGAEAEAALVNVPFAFNDEQLLSCFDKPGTFPLLMDAFNGSFSAFSDAAPEVKPDTAPGKTKASKKEAGATSGGN